MDAHLAEELKATGRAAGLDAVGIASASAFHESRQALEDRQAAGLSGGMQFTYRNPARSTDPQQALPGARSLVVGARHYRRQPPASARVGEVAGRVARYSWVDHYRPLRAALEEVAARLRAGGWAARVLADDNALVDRAAAQRAGLGWLGKNTNLLLPGAGSWFLLGSVITDAELPPDPVVEEGCGGCRACQLACPTGALERAGVLDARRCLAWLVQAPGPFPREHRVALGDRMYGCDDCQESCPANRLAARLSDPPPAEAAARASVDLLELLAASDEEVLAQVGRWYIPDRQVRYVRRNALLVLGNVADPAAPGVEATLRRALADPDGLVRAHAVWAAARLGRLDLARGLAGDEDLLVRSELAAAPGVPARGGPAPYLVAGRPVAS